MHAPELVWRRSPNTAEHVQSSAPVFRPQHQADAAVTAVHAATSTRLYDEALKREAGAVQRMSLDSATIDRLTDDVIRRVERRIRIERERRGL